MKFDCTVCGACCTRIHDQWIGYEQFLKNGWILSDGTCINYDPETRHCRIYATRPDVCDVVSEYAMVNPPVTLQQWFLHVEQCCDEAHEREYGCKRERGETCHHRK